ncbi:type VI secretion system-associated protein TagF [uncultured Thiodictyon sp.]|uniref:type VI secretion system-associated protein TagF n=1 Tax=uncultured Thiodictyon sp. TaxID=1846217 RepID=UPI0025DCADF0|nr:type VI secretion system-associated protein TagF [uncultured Thiodictyon sp.]
MNSTTGTTGFYGKFPSLGDFVNRRLATELIAPWDQWLQESLAASRAQLGDGWLDQYLTSPLWRFVLSPGVAGQGGWAGVLMPSVDRVGRYFPLTLAAPLPIGTNPFELLSAQDWFEQVEVLALSGLVDPFSLEAFDGQVLALGNPGAGPASLGASPLAGGGGRSNAWHLSAPNDGDFGGARNMLLAQAFDQVFLAYSLWWSQGSDQVAPSLLACQGLPPPEGFSALLTGDWGGCGWRQLGAVPAAAVPEV